MSNVFGDVLYWPADNKVVRLTGSQILSPVSHWPQSARPYVDLYKKNRLLSDHYCNDSNLNGVLIPLIEAQPCNRRAFI